MSESSQTCIILNTFPYDSRNDPAVWPLQIWQLLVDTPESLGVNINTRIRPCSTRIHGSLDHKKNSKQHYNHKGVIIANQFKNGF